MSKYTTEVRYICESYAGYDESKGYSSVDSILTTSAPMVFNFDFPIFDEAYRLILEKKILRHFYTREISEETVGLWKLRLEDKMNLIMPYYNKLYNSELLNFNPLYDTDYTINHSGEGEDTLVETNNNTRTFNKDTGVDETTGNTRTLNTTETNTNTRTLNTSEGNNNTRTLNTTDAESNSSANKNVRWDLFSDTPQGGINGITADADSVANNTYLTNARKITDDGTGSTSSRQLNQTGTIGDSGTKTNTGTIGDSGSRANTGTISDSGTRSSDMEERGTIGDSGGRNVNSSNLNSYIDRVSGKRGTMSYGKMIQEFRDSLLRIDEMIIKELNPLFFGLWN